MARDLRGPFSFGGTMNGTSAVFFDGGYLDKVLQHDYDDPRIDFQSLAHTMCDPDELLRAYYYHCLPYQSSTPTQEERQRYSRMHRFTTALSHLPRFEVRLGKLAYRGEDHQGRPIFQQKQVDCMVGVDMALLASKGRISSIAVFTGDSDLIPAVEAVKNEGVLVTLWHGNSTQTRPSRELFELVDERRELTADLVRKLQRT